MPGAAFCLLLPVCHRPNDALVSQRAKNIDLSSERSAMEEREEVKEGERGGRSALIPSDPVPAAGDQAVRGLINEAILSLLISLSLICNMMRMVNLQVTGR